MQFRLFFVVALALVIGPAGGRAADSGGEDARAARLREIVEEHFLGQCCTACRETCSVEEILASLDPASQMVIGPAPDLDFIRGLSADVPPPEVQVDSGGRVSIRLASFGRRTGRQFLAATGSLDPSRLSSIRLDVRGNGGGCLESALEIAGAFAPRGALLLDIAGRSGVRIFQSRGRRRFASLSVQVLVDERTASSAEVLAWLLRRYAGARILGRRTAGKGTVQEVYRVDPRARLVLTTGVYRLPDGTPLGGTGIEPDSEERNE
ncbi:MAG: S41 family peptidase [Gammaproteobacteria bacterium]